MVFSAYTSGSQRVDNIILLYHLPGEAKTAEEEEGRRQKSSNGAGNRKQRTNAANEASDELCALKWAARGRERWNTV